MLIEVVGPPVGGVSLRQVVLISTRKSAANETVCESANSIFHGSCYGIFAVSFSNRGDSV